MNTTLAKNLSLLILLTFSISVFAFTSPNNSGTISGKGNLPNEKKISKASISFINEETTIKSLNKIPRKSESFELNEKEYHFYNGMYYALNGEVYENVEAPIGVEVKKLPEDYQRIIMSGRIYYYSTGVFYMPKGKKAFVTSYGPKGGQVSKLPEGTQKVKIDGREYYLYHNTVFKKGSSRTRNFYELFGYVVE